MRGNLPLNMPMRMAVTVLMLLPMAAGCGRPDKLQRAASCMVKDGVVFSPAKQELMIAAPPSVPAIRCSSGESDRDEDNVEPSQEASAQPPSAQPQFFHPDLTKGSAEHTAEVARPAS